MKTAQHQFFSGVPVAPDVKLLMDQIGDLVPGREIAHEEVETVIALDHKSSRYRTVVARWMRELWDDLNVRVIGMRGGFVVLTPEGRLDQGEHQRVKGVKRLTQAVKEAVTVPAAELSPIESQRHDHLVRTNVMALAAVKAVQTDYGMALKKKPESLPRNEARFKDK